ncbi:RcpC/CpaB family pilus assembly protein [Wukongibacter sp. M2B1]|uniref:RcpC/CpaB family pilus assembly protein n=1 Tax=Wukongibacter sp. M2B1 TaxID=3088895 RepID=UPI003D7BADBC
MLEYDYLENFTGDRRAIAVTLRNFASGLSGKLQNGDIVSVYVADYGDKKETLSPIELKYVEVLAVTLVN